MQVKDVAQYLEEWAPIQYAESYDNAGLLAGNPDLEVTGILVSLDCTEAVIAEARATGCNMVVSHHPIVFKGLKKLTGATYVERTVISAIKSDVAIYAIHTNLDNQYTGVNARIAKRLGLRHTSVLSPRPDALRKLTFFVPESHTDAVRDAVYLAGAGSIGAYEGCSFNVEGTGTFTPAAGANPFIGAAGEAESVKEVRVEVMFQAHLQRRVVKAMKQAHPYEEVAHYIGLLGNENQYLGAGMIGTLPEPMDAPDFLAHVKERMLAAMVRHTALTGKKVERVALCGGSGSFLLGAAIRARADFYISSDFKYHEFFDADGKIVIADIGHFESEQFTMDLIAEKLREKFNTFATRLSQVKTNPVHYF